MGSRQDWRVNKQGAEPSQRRHKHEPKYSQWRAKSMLGLVVTSTFKKFGQLFFKNAKICLFWGVWLPNFTWKCN